MCQHGEFWTGYTEALIGFATEDPAILRLIDRRHEINTNCEKNLEEAEGMITFLWLGEDLGAKIGLYTASTCFVSIYGLACKGLLIWPKNSVSIP